jgi:hypothetical protein
MELPTFNNNQRGIALPMVLALIVIITLLGFTAMSLAENQTLMVTRSQQQEKALHYAEAGIHHYLYMLNGNRDFYKTTESDDLQKIDTAFESGFYRLTVSPPSTTTPIVTIRSTGWTKSRPDLRRTIEVSVHKREFVQNIYASGKEVNDKDEEVWWIQGDVVNGPLHTNGSLNINGYQGRGSTGPVFYGPVTYSGARVNFMDDREGTTEFHKGRPVKVPPLVFPSTNSALKSIADNDGYLYEGRTCIYINGNSLTIRDKDGNVSNRSLPPNGVIYVDGNTGNKWGTDTANVFVSGTLEGRLTIATANDIYITAWDPTNWDQPDSSGPKGTYTGGLSYAGYDGSNITDIDDMLGLIAAGYVRILHDNWPRSGNNLRWNNYDVAPDNITIHGAIFALNHSFEYENWDSGGAKDTVTLLGSITQNSRGAVGTYNPDSGKIISGYLKDYTHDPRMLYDMPPHFLEPTNSGWEIKSWKEVN